MIDEDDIDNNKILNLETKIEIIKNIRTHINDSYIILYDSNELNDDDYDLLNNNVDIFINDKKVSEKKYLTENN